MFASETIAGHGTLFYLQEAALLRCARSPSLICAGRKMLSPISKSLTTIHGPKDSWTKRWLVKQATSSAFPGRRIDRLDGSDRANLGFLQNSTSIY
jgi:hypothetical protein